MDTLAGKQMEPEILSSRRLQSACSQLSIILYNFWGLSLSSELLWPNIAPSEAGERGQEVFVGWAENTQTS